ncbi:MAG: ABC transporter ATP-binding protein [Thermoproteota archaeon]|nr:MAG: ABC transporter ATP-binding protein [Candidatus Korarchaeota archaeon]RLG51268.1 MAG: ABC transporter ATP-binding protein [Candidatus Korarchaeota archaeon]
MILEVRNLTKKFGGLIAVRNVSLALEKGDVLGLIGPNGAGKTTLINVVSGIYRPDGGRIYFKGSRIDGLEPYKIARRGLCRTFQIPKLFDKMTVIENLLVPAYAIEAESIYGKAVDTLKFIGLEHLMHERAMNLSGGQKKLLEFGRVLMLDPEVMLLDEPFAGVAPSIKEQIMKLIKELSEQGRSFLIVSHDMPSVFGLCERIAVMSAGEKIAEGAPESIRNDIRVIEAYLGG